MELTQLKKPNNLLEATSLENESGDLSCVSLESEIPEILYLGMKDFINSNPQWDQYSVMSSALARFLFQNGCDERAVTEQYLNDLFNRIPA